jgi:succinoglycan biosynthesis transport protein ExoP
MQSLYRWPQIPALSIIRTLWKRKLLISMTTILAGFLGTAIVFRLPAVYRAEVLILVESQRIPERFVAPTVSTDLNNRLSNIRQQIMSYTRLLTIINKYNLYRRERQEKAEEEVIEIMRKNIDVRLEQGWSKDQPGAFRISYEGREPAVVAQVANELGDLFIDQNLRSREVYALGTSEFIESQLAEAKKRLEEQEGKLTAYKRQHNGELPQQENALVASLSRLQVQLQGVQDETSRTEQTKILKESELDTAQTSQTALVQITERMAEGGSAPGDPTNLEKETAELEKQLAALRTRYTENHPDVKAAREALAKLKERETKRTAQQAGEKPDAGPRQTPNPNTVMMSGTLIRERERVEQLKTQQAVAAKQLADLEADRQRILREITAVQARLQQLPIREQQIAGIARDYEMSKANYQSLLDKKLSAQMATQMEKNQKSERFTVLDSGRVPEKPVAPDRLLLSIAAWLAGLILAVAAALGVEFNKNVVLGEWELPKDTPILGRVPRIVIRNTGARLALQTNGQPQLASQRAK